MIRIVKRFINNKIERTLQSLSYQDEHGDTRPIPIWKDIEEEWENIVHENDYNKFLKKEYEQSW